MMTMVDLVDNQPGTLSRLVGWVEVIVTRIWPVGYAAYLAAVAVRPGEILSLGGPATSLIATAAAAACVVFAVWPGWMAVQMAVAGIGTVALCGRAVTIALYTAPDWPAVAGVVTLWAGLVVMVALAVLIHGTER